MNEYKFCFIICTNNNLYLDECIHYLKHLVIPEGYELDLISITEAASMTAGYQEAMENSDAKYKIYLHQDVFVLNKNFLIDLLSIFQADLQIGMIGMVGYETVSPNGIMWHVPRSGSIFRKKDASSYPPLEQYQYSLIQDSFSYVAEIDGILMATCVDLTWNTIAFILYSSNLSNTALNLLIIVFLFVEGVKSPVYDVTHTPLNSSSFAT